MLKINDTLGIPIEEFHSEYSRSGGPGGQNVNKVNSKVQLRWRPAQNTSLPAGVRGRLLRMLAPRLTKDGELLVTSQRTRDQARNLADCLGKVRDLVRIAANPPRARRPTRPTAASQRHRVEAKQRHSASKKLRRAPDSE